MSDGLEASRRRARRNVVLTAAIAGLGGLLFGYDTGVIAGALLFIKDDFGLNSFEQGLVIAAVPIGAVAGAAFAGPSADRYGRRMMIMLAAAVFIVGALVSAASQGVALLVEGLGKTGAFWFYAAVGMTLVFCWKFVPETKGKRLEDIQAYFRSRVDA